MPALPGFAQWIVFFMVTYLVLERVIPRVVGILANRVAARAEMHIIIYREQFQAARMWAELKILDDKELNEKISKFCWSHVPDKDIPDMERYLRGCCSLLVAISATSNLRDQTVARLGKLGLPGVASELQGSIHETSELAKGRLEEVGIDAEALVIAYRN